MIDPATQKIVATITFDGKGMEDLALDSKKRRLYQAVKGANTIGVVDLDSNQIVARGRSRRTRSRMASRWFLKWTGCW